jgi:ABC-type glycerol-3-phosphate transport system substrate-binding protein
MKKISRALALLLVGATLLSGCSMLTASGRQQRAYERYVRKSSLGRVKQQKLFHSGKTQMPVTRPTEQLVAAEVSGPESISAGSGDGSGQ